MCGVVGIISNEPVCQYTARAAIALENRGTDSTGLMSFNTKRRSFGLKIRETGSASEVLGDKDLSDCVDTIAIAHNRYATSGGVDKKKHAADAQPLYIQKPGIALVHNGQIANYISLQKRLEKEKSYSFATECDAEALLFALAQNLIDLHPYQTSNHKQFVDEKLFPALERTINPDLEEDSSKYYSVTGAYSTVAIIANHGLLAFKDPHSVRPLCFGKRTDGKTKQFVFASETTALEYLGGDFEDVRELGPGEAVFVDLDLNVYEKEIHNMGLRACPFEDVYFSQIDSVFRGQSVYEARERLGMFLAARFFGLAEKVDLVTPVPKSPIPAAEQVARAWNKKYGGVVARPSHSNLRAFLKVDYGLDKLIMVPRKFNDNSVAGIDDSVVRGGTSTRFIAAARRLGATAVHFFSTYPPFVNICAGGIDVVNQAELILKDNTPEAIEAARKKIGADSLNFLPLEDMLSAVNLTPEAACLGCTEGKYPYSLDDYANFQEMRDASRKCDGCS